MHLKSALQYNILVRASHVVADSRLMDTSSFLVKLLAMFYFIIVNVYNYKFIIQVLVF